MKQTNNTNLTEQELEQLRQTQQKIQSDEAKKRLLQADFDLGVMSKNPLSIPLPKR